MINVIISFITLRQIANADILPFDVRRYATAITTFIDSLKKQFGEEWKTHNVNIGKYLQLIYQFLLHLF